MSHPDCRFVCVRRLKRSAVAGSKLTRTSLKQRQVSAAWSLTQHSTCSQLGPDRRLMSDASHRPMVG